MKKFKWKTVSIRFSMPHESLPAYRELMLSFAYWSWRREQDENRQFFGLHTDGDTADE